MISHNLIFDLPIKCDFYQFKLIKELLENPHPASGHFGNVCVIGLWKKVPNFNEDYLYSLECDERNDNPFSNFRDRIKIPLVFLENFIHQVYYGSHVEINGELCYRNTISNGGITNARHLMIQLQKEQTELEKALNLPSRAPTGLNDETLAPSVKDTLLKMVEKIKNEYKPVIQVHNMTEIGNARDLIRANLVYRDYRVD